MPLVLFFEKLRQFDSHERGAESEASAGGDLHAPLRQMDFRWLNAEPDPPLLPDEVPDEVLKKVYYKNAIRLVPGIDAQAFPD